MVVASPSVYSNNGYMAANEVDHESNPRGTATAAICITFTAVAFVILSLRVYTRLFVIRNLGSEDYVAILATCFSIAFTTLVCIQVDHGLGRHADTIHNSNETALLKAFYASVPTYEASITLTKISIVLQYHRVFVGKKITKAIRVMLGVDILYGLWAILATSLMCIPTAYFWDSRLEGHCLNSTAIYFTNASLNIVTDIITLVLPMPVIGSLQLPRKQKLALMVGFGLGGFVCLCSILRLNSLRVISQSRDKSYDNAPAAYWSAVEANMAIICSCLPTLKGFVTRYFKGFLESTSYNLTVSANRRKHISGTLPINQSGNDLGGSTNALQFIELRGNGKTGSWQALDAESR
ncbi:hypothetical protein K402DRAFT_424873 [Aulographum hederae CBS 113979]|uniref:Rhodopsin domain-containing protein n=1 Tax=Aulographum hederae CBS 113979 TaxID=1176131 RepID=A0A6G1GM38_9PEZI|nr:hypothetical protein K402DRAFT_424873 [Aulographum hederae CBS 113979]